LESPYAYRPAKSNLGPAKKTADQAIPAIRIRIL